ncbi:MAG: sigma-70 family RNA polymerase sigma factor [Planctomycetota bacterium]
MKILEPQDSMAHDGHHQLVEELRSGSERALADLFELYRPRLIHIVAARMDKRLRGRVDPSDLLQETFLDLSSRLPSFVVDDRGLSAFVWMRLTAVEKVIHSYRRHLHAARRDIRREADPAVLQPHSSMALADQLCGRFTSVGRKAIRAEIAETVQETLKQMQEIDYEIITMRCFEELSNAEAAQSLGISENGASSRFVRAMARLKTELSKIPGFDD